MKQDEFSATDVAAIVYSYTVNDLATWLISPSHIDVDGLESPSEQSIWSAMRFIADFYRRKEEMPVRIVEDGEGGIVMDAWNDSETTSYSIDRDGRIEKMCFRDSLLVSREDVVLETVEVPTA